MLDRHDISNKGKYIQYFMGATRYGGGDDGKRSICAARKIPTIAIEISYLFYIFIIIIIIFRVRAISIFRVIFVVICFLHISSYTCARTYKERLRALSISIRCSHWLVDGWHHRTAFCYWPGAPTNSLSNIPIIPLSLVNLSLTSIPAARLWLWTMIEQIMLRSMNRKRIHSESHFESNTI